MDSIAAKVRAVIKCIGANVAFTTAALLPCGSRNAIDIELCRLVKKGAIRRLAAGVFIEIADAAHCPGSSEIVKLKAQRFGKSIVGIEDSARDSNKRVYFTSGCRSSFKTIFGRVQLKHRAARNWVNTSKQQDEINNLRAPYKSESVGLFDKSDNESTRKIIQDLSFILELRFQRFLDALFSEKWKTERDGLFRVLASILTGS